MTADIDRVRSEVRDGVQDFIQYIDWGDEIPTTEIAVGNSQQMSQRVPVEKPSKVVTDDLWEDLFGEDPQETPLDDVAEWMYESGEGFELELSNDEGERIEDPDKESVVGWYRHILTNFAVTVMDYTGSFSFDDESFETAFEREFVAKYYNDRNEYEVIRLLTQFDGPDSPIKLTTDVDLSTDDKPDIDVKSIEISRVTADEMSGIYTHESRFTYQGSSGFSPFDRPEYKIKVKVISEADYDGAVGGVISQVITSLRLFKSETADIGPSKIYSLNKDWLTFRTGIPNINTSKPSVNSSGSKRDYTLSAGQIADFKEFWEEYGGLFYGSDNLNTAIRRFEQMYSKESTEDQLIDAVIGFEATLLKEIHSTESYRYRLPVRATVLLAGVAEHDRDWIYRFFKKLYDARSKVVHTGGELGTQTVEGDDLSPTDFAQYARDYLRLTIIRYMNLLDEYPSIDEINKEVDDVMKKASLG